MTRVRTLRDLGAAEIEGCRYLVRVDYNVPLDEEGRVTDATRIDATIPTLTLLCEGGASLVLVSHLGRPEGVRDPSASLEPVAAALSERLPGGVRFVPEGPDSAEARAVIGRLGRGDVALLENIRFHPGETTADPDLSRALGALGEGFVGEAFGTAHRAHASTVGAAREIRNRGGAAVAGLLMEREIHFLGDVLNEPKRPFVTIMGGAKISGKLGLIRSILRRVDRLLIGGAMASTFLRALGLSIGRSLVEEELVPLARELMEEAGDKLILPVDCVVASEISPGASAREVDRGQVRDEDMIGDIGPVTGRIFARELAAAQTVLWNGPLGVFEMPAFSAGTVGVARALADAADAGTTVVVGGGDSVAAAKMAAVTTRMTHVSTGGGASLDFLAGNELPGISVLETVGEG